MIVALQRAEEQEDHHDDEHEGLDQGADDLADRVLDEGRRVVDDGRLQALGETLFWSLASVLSTAAAVETALAPGER